MSQNYISPRANHLAISIRGFNVTFHLTYKKWLISIIWVENSFDIYCIALTI